jgi:hypothetical protein
MENRNTSPENMHAKTRFLFLKFQTGSPVVFIVQQRGPLEFRELSHSPSLDLSDRGKILAVLILQCMYSFFNLSSFYPCSSQVPYRYHPVQTVSDQTMSSVLLHYSFRHTTGWC